MLISSIFAVVLLTIVDVAKNANQRMTDNIFYDNYNNVLTVEAIGNPMSHGTGVLIKTAKNRLVVLTNKHVCNALEPNILINNDLITSTESVLYKDEIVDLCLLTVSKDLKVKDIKLAPEPARKNQTIFSLGYPYDFSKNLIEGRIIGDALIPVYEIFMDQEKCKAVPVINNIAYCYNEENLVSTNALQFPGGSGSPVFNSNNELVGLMAVSHGMTHFGGMIYLKDIRRVLNKF